jgi:signal transduction histidine kinase
VAEPSFPALSKREMFRALWGGIPKAFLIPAVLTVALTTAFMVVSERTYTEVSEAVDARRIARDRLDYLDNLLIMLVNAETGQRGYLLTGKGEYLKPLVQARAELPALQAKILLAFRDYPGREKQVDELAMLVINKFVELEMTVALFDQGKRDDAIRMVGNDTGKAFMDAARLKVAALSEQMTAELNQARRASEHSLSMSRLGMFVIAFLNLSLLTCTLYLFIKDMQQRQILVEMRETENQRLTTLVDERTSELNELSTHLQRSGEQDRAGLARDLHDELGGILTSAKMDLDWLRTHATHTPEALRRIEQISSMLDEGVSVKRRVIENLRPSLLDNLGLAPALEWYITENCSKGGLKCTLNLAEELGVISPDASIALFRIVQEGTTNVLRHAKAKNFTASLQLQGKNIHLILEDDGAGLPPSFNPTKLSHGLSGIRQRARSLGGDATWKSIPGKGTTITVIIPRNVDENDVDMMSAAAA